MNTLSTCVRLYLHPLRMLTSHAGSNGRGQIFSASELETVFMNIEDIIKVCTSYFLPVTPTDRYFLPRTTPDKRTLLDPTSYL